MARKETPKTDWAGLSREMDCLLRLKASPVAYKRLEKAAELDKIPELVRLDRRASFCQVPAMVRTMGLTIGATRENFGDRCARINGLAPIPWCRPVRLSCSPRWRRASFTPMSS